MYQWNQLRDCCLAKAVVECLDSVGLHGESAESPQGEDVQKERYQAGVAETTQQDDEAGRKQGRGLRKPCPRDQQAAAEETDGSQGLVLRDDGSSLRAAAATPPLVAAARQTHQLE